MGFGYGTSSDIDGSNFEDPQDISDIAAIETDIGGRQPATPRRPPMGGIDLGKGLDLEKPKPPRSAIGIEIGKSAGGNLGIGVEVPIGLSPFGARGGVAIDPATGQIRGGYGGLGIGKGPIAASIDVGVDNGGCFRYVTVSAGPFSHTYGQNVCEPKQPSAQDKADNSSQKISSEFPSNISVPGAGSPPNFAVGCLVYEYYERYAIGGFNVLDNSITGFPNQQKSEEPPPFVQEVRSAQRALSTSGGISYQYFSGGNPEPVYPPNINSATYITIVSDYYRYNPSGSSSGWLRSGLTINTFARSLKNNPKNEWVLLSIELYEVRSTNCPVKPLPAYSPPIPNPPPKKMNDDCCKVIIALQLETLRMMGRQVSSSQLLPVSNKPGFLGEEIERKETPIDPKNPSKKVKIKFNSLYELFKYSLKEQIALDEAIDPRSFERPTGKIQNPEYNRNAGQSLMSNNQPDKDKNGNKRELEINKDLEILSVLQQQKYIFEALRRLEYLFPFGELSDALIEKSLLIPGAKGEIKIHNMIQAYEIQMQYLDATLGNPREILTIKDANPAIEGDQPIEVRSLSISDLLQQNIKFHIDTGGDVDALVNLVLRDFRTNLANRIDLIKTIEMTQALFEDSGMREDQDYIKVHLEGDPYAGQWIKGQGFQPNPDLEKKTEEATEKVLRETMKPGDIKIKVSRRHKDEKTDMRDLLRGLADFIQRLLSVPSGGDAAKSIDKLVESAKFKVQTEMALIRQNVTQAAAASRNRTKKRKK